MLLKLADFARCISASCYNIGERKSPCVEALPSPFSSLGQPSADLVYDLCRVFFTRPIERLSLFHFCPFWFRLVRVRGLKLDP
jgi:hypothetical protein